jgi:hypothetical protein
MTESQKFEAYGRALSTLKAARLELAAARERFATYMEDVRNSVAAMESFAREPLARDHENRPLADYSYTWHARICRPDFQELIHDLFQAANKAAKAEEQAKAFE